MGSNKNRVLRLLRYLWENTDAQHRITTNEIIELFRDSDVSCNRITVANDIRTLQEEGYDVRCVMSGANSYYMEERIFSETEVRILIDAVLAAGFIPSKRKQVLVDKLTRFVSSYKKKSLVRNLSCAKEGKGVRSTLLFENVNCINEAINEKVTLRFQYLAYDFGKSRHQADYTKIREISPFTLLWDGRHFYLEGYSDAEGGVAVFRLDRMKNPVLTHTPALEKKSLSCLKESSDSEDSQNVLLTLVCQNDFADAVLDRFGEKVEITKKTQETFCAKIKTVCNTSLYAWVFESAGGISIAGPESARRSFLELVSKAVI